MNSGTGWNLRAADFVDVEQAARSNHVDLKPYVAGESFEFGGVHVRVLNPQPGWQPRDPPQDDESLVLRMQYGRNFSVAGGRLA